MRVRVTITAALLLWTGAPAAAQGASVAPWVIMSAVASPASSREVCRERKSANRHLQGSVERQHAEGERCALPVGAAANGIVASSAARGLASLPLLTGLTMVIGTTAYLLANKQPRGWLTYPISPD